MAARLAENSSFFQIIFEILCEKFWSSNQTFQKESRDNNAPSVNQHGFSTRRLKQTHWLAIVSKWIIHYDSYRQFHHFESKSCNLFYSESEPDSEIKTWVSFKNVLEYRYEPSENFQNNDSFLKHKTLNLRLVQEISIIIHQLMS